MAYSAHNRRYRKDVQEMQELPDETSLAIFCFKKISRRQEQPRAVFVFENFENIKAYVSIFTGKQLKRKGLHAFVYSKRSKRKIA